MSSMHDYKYSIEQCDIVDKKKGKVFRSKRRQWMEWLSGEDPHTISTQIYSILWDYALFCTVNELRRIATEEPEKEVGFNGPVMRLFDAGFVTTQATTIRRLIEKPKSSHKLAVISLRRILKDIKENIDLITRENYVCYDGLPYDYEAVHQKWIANLPRNRGGVHVGTLPTNGPEAWPMSERVHKNFDRLSQVDPKNRKRTDHMKTEVLEFLESQIEKCGDIKKYVDKFIAHAAVPETRSGLTENQKILTLERLETCHKIIYQVASFISGPLLWESNLGGLPVPQYDHLVNLEKSWVSPKNLKIAHQKWDEFAKKVSSWDSTSFWPPGFKNDSTNKA